MASTYKILGQVHPASTSNADLYTVPAGVSTIVSTLSVTNLTNSDATFRIYVRQNGIATSDGNAYAKDFVIAAKSVANFTTGMTLDSEDKITVQTANANALTFMMFGQEIQ